MDGDEKDGDDLGWTKEGVGLGWIRVWVVAKTIALGPSRWWGWGRWCDVQGAIGMNDEGGPSYASVEGKRSQGGSMEAKDPRRTHARVREADQPRGPQEKAWIEGNHRVHTQLHHHVSHVTPNKTKTKGTKAGNDGAGGRESRQENATAVDNDNVDGKEGVHASSVPHHTQPVQETSTVEHAPLATNDVVWVRVRGFPWWPAKVRVQHHANDKKLETIPKKKKNTHTHTHEETTHETNRKRSRRKNVEKNLKQTNKKTRTRRGSETKLTQLQSHDATQVMNENQASTHLRKEKKSKDAQLVQFFGSNDLYVQPKVDVRRKQRIERNGS